MIPLAKWLQDDDPQQPDFMPSLAMAPVLPDETAGPEQHQAELEDAYQRGLADGAAERDARHAEALAELEARAAGREAEIEAEWSAKFSADLAANISESLSAMRSGIEQALESVLGAFLEDEVRRKLSTSILQTIEDETSGSGRIPLEISAPEHLHEQIRAQCEMRGLTLSLTHSSEIKVVFRDGLLRFDDMSKQWSDMIRDTRS